MKIKSGIYCIKNTINNKVYIGRSNNVRKRCSQHMRYLELNKHPNKHLQYSYHKYGKNNFINYVVEYADSSLLKELEIKHINLHDSLNENKGYNISNPLLHVYFINKKAMEENKKTNFLKTAWKNSIEKRIKPVLQYDLQGNFIKKWESGKEASKNLLLDNSSITKCCKNKNKRVGNYIFKYDRY